MLTIYKNETTLHSITASVDGEGRFKITISNAYDFEYEQYNGTKKIILIIRMGCLVYILRKG